MSEQPTMIRALLAHLPTVLASYDKDHLLAETMPILFAADDLCERLRGIAVTRNFEETIGRVHDATIDADDNVWITVRVTDASQLRITDTLPELTYSAQYQYVTSDDIVAHFTELAFVRGKSWPDPRPSCAHTVDVE